MKSKYLSAFQALKANCKDSYRTVGDGIWVEEIKADDLIKKGSIYIPTTVPTGMKMVDGVEQNKPMLVWVLDVGEGYYDDEGEDVPVEVQPGDIAIVGKLSVNWMSVFGDIMTHDKTRLGFTRESEIKHYWKGIEGYTKYFETFKSALPSDVGNE